MKAIAYLLSFASLCFALEALCQAVTDQATAAGLAVYTALTLALAYAALLVEEGVRPEPPKINHPAPDLDEEHHRQAICDCLKKRHGRTQS